VSLEFSKVVGKVQEMGAYLGAREHATHSKLSRAVELYYAAVDRAVIHERIEHVRRSISGYRGAALAPAPYDETLCDHFFAEALRPATLIAADGSQVYPDAHAPALYYLINTGVFTYYHAQGMIPEPFTTPELEFNQDKLIDRDGRSINNQTVNNRRTLREMQALADSCWAHRQANTHRPLPLVGLHDGGLLKFFGGAEVPDAKDIESEYLKCLQKLHDSRALLAGYVDRPRSTSVIALLHLLSLDQDQITDAAVKTNGELEGLSDLALFGAVLPPGARSAIVTQNSPQNREFMTRLGPDYEIALFYVNASETDYPVIARVELPMWVASDQASVDILHAFVLQQCAIQGRKRYPYALTRADELAYISGAEKRQLEELIRISMLEHAITPDQSNKLQSKGLARSSKQQHKIR
jgi:hypothetical protein